MHVPRYNALPSDQTIFKWTKTKMLNFCFEIGNMYNYCNQDCFTMRNKRHVLMPVDAAPLASPSTVAHKADIRSRELMLVAQSM
jgi:hypothetical protein